MTNAVYLFFLKIWNDERFRCMNARSVPIEDSEELDVSDVECNVVCFLCLYGFFFFLIFSVIPSVIFQVQ